MTGPALPAHDRPVDDTPVHTDQLPPTPVRDRNIPVTAWVEAPPEALHLGDGLAEPLTTYKRRIGPWLLWRAGPATKADARYLALLADDLSVQHTFHLLADGSGEGTGPSGERHTRFRTWKQDLQAAGSATPPSAEQ